MALSEIEKLERRYAENPQGLTFAPLAEVHRKNGDVARALDLLRPGLQLHPDYIPASIVLGRCHLDLGDLPAAEQAFSHVLVLDAENVIALKALAEIAERQHHFDRAEQWLDTLLAVDRTNDEARVQLERIATARHDAASAPPPPALAADEEVAAPAEAAAGSVSESIPAPAAEAEREREGEVAPEPPAPVAAAAPPEPVAGWTAPPVEAIEVQEPAPLAIEDLEPIAMAEASVEPPPAGLQVEEPVGLEVPVEPLEGLIGRDVDEAKPGDEEFRVELSEDIVLRSSGSHEYQVPDAAAELSDRLPAPAPSSPFGEERRPMFGGLEEAPAPEAEVAGGSESEPEPKPAGHPGSPPGSLEMPVAETAPPAPATVGSEAAVAGGEAPAVEPSAAAEAAESPRVPEPASGVPEEPPPGIPAVVAEAEPELVVTETMAKVLLQQGHSAEALRVYRELEVRNTGDPRLLQRIAELEADSAATPPGRRAYVAAETGGQSVREFFQGLLAARPAGGSAPAAPRPAAASPADGGGAPTRPAPDALSLSSVFGEETTPLPPAVPTTPGALPAGVSFDEFYGGTGGGPAKPRTPDPKSDDLDQFHTWLQNLKR